ncbi:hypothetical protein BJ912DRAFT_1062844 [Pholiota molesta]|nr:hypothetical protein BJ912DRAFT_1062844 [Pholiota molesta]
MPPKPPTNSSMPPDPYTLASSNPIQGNDTSKIVCDADSPSSRLFVSPKPHLSFRASFPPSRRCLRPTPIEPTPKLPPSRYLSSKAIHSSSLFGQPTHALAIAACAERPRARPTPTHELARRLAGIAKALLHDVNLRVLRAGCVNDEHDEVHGREYGGEDRVLGLTRGASGGYGGWSEPPARKGHGSLSPLAGKQFVLGLAIVEWVSSTRGTCFSLSCKFHRALLADSSAVRGHLSRLYLCPPTLNRPMSPSTLFNSAPNNHTFLFFHKPLDTDLKHPYDAID